MPVAWIKSYQLPGGKKGKAFTTTMGASIEIPVEGTCRMIVNGIFWSLDIPVPAEGAKVEMVGDFKPNTYGFLKDPYWDENVVNVSDFQ